MEAFHGIKDGNSFASHKKNSIYEQKSVQRTLGFLEKKHALIMFFFFFFGFGFWILKRCVISLPHQLGVWTRIFFLVRPCHPCHLHRNEAKDTRGSWVCGRLSRSTLYLRFFTRIPQLICPEPWRVLVCLYKNQDFGNRKKCIYFLHMSIYLIKKSI